MAAIGPLGRCWHALPGYRPCLRYVRRTVDAPHLAQPVAHLAQGGTGAERLLDGRQDVADAIGRRLEGAEVLVHDLLVAVLPELPEPSRLGLLDPGIDAKRLVRLLDVRGEPVHPDDHPSPVVGLLCYLVGGTLDLGLLEAPLDG